MTALLVRSLLLACLLLLLARGRTAMEAAREMRPWLLTWPDAPAFLLAAAAGIALLALAALYLRGLSFLAQRGLTIRRRNDLPRSPLLLALTSMVAAPLIEEATMRGFVLGGLLLPAWGPAPALLLSALVFALAHPLPSMPWAAAAGVVLGVAALQGESIWGAVLAHAAVNAWATGRLLRGRAAESACMGP